MWETLGNHHTEFGYSVADRVHRWGTDACLSPRSDRIFTAGDRAHRPAHSSVSSRRARSVWRKRLVCNTTSEGLLFRPSLPISRPPIAFGTPGSTPKQVLAEKQAPDASVHDNRSDMNNPFKRSLASPR